MMEECCINMGKGEYVIYRNDGEISYDEYQNLYEIITGSAHESPRDKLSNIILSKNNWNKDINIIFIPKTLYELFLIKELITEDIRNKSICSFVCARTASTDIDCFEDNKDNEYRLFLEKKTRIQKERNCLHGCYFHNGNKNNNDNIDVIRIAYKINNIIVHILSCDGNKSWLKYKDIMKYTDDIINSLQEYYRKCNDKSDKSFDKLSSCNWPGPTTNFGYESRRGKIRPLGIRNNEDADIIRKAISIECKEIAHDNYILYRGSNIIEDNIYDKTGNAYSLSYGTSLFAGCVFDGGACAFHYMRTSINAYAIILPYTDINKSLFYIPESGTIPQIFSDGEIFHIRTKSWKNFNVKNIGGMNTGAGYNQRDHLVSEIEKEDLLNRFKLYINSSIQLK